MSYSTYIIVTITIQTHGPGVIHGLVKTEYNNVAIKYLSSVHIGPWLQTQAITHVIIYEIFKTVIGATLHRCSKRLDCVRNTAIWRWAVDVDLPNGMSNWNFDGLSDNVTINQISWQGLKCLSDNDDAVW